MVTYNTAIRNEQDIEELVWSDSFKGLILFVFLMIHGAYGDNPSESECMLVASLNNQGYFKISNDYEERVTEKYVSQIRDSIKDSDPSDNLLKRGFIKLRKNMWATWKKGGPSSIGTKYEREVHRVVTCCKLGQTPFNTQPESDLGGSSSRHDIRCNHIETNNIGIEAKNTLRAEYIQLDIHLENDVWLGPKRTKKSHPETVVDRYLQEVNRKNTEGPLFYGKPPCFPYESREAFDLWEAEFMKEKLDRGGDGKNKEYQWTLDDKDFILKNYREKGNRYIQINGYGLYHLGTDPCGFGVPRFEPGVTELRIRCKRRNEKGCIPNSLTVSAWAKDLEPSQFSLDDINRLPENLTYTSPVITSQ